MEKSKLTRLFAIHNACGECILSYLCLLANYRGSICRVTCCLFILYSKSQDHAAWTEKESLRRCSCASNCHTDIYLIIMQTYGISITLVLYSVACFCDCACTEHCDTRYLPFLMPHLFFMKAQRALEAFSFNKCVPESRTERTDCFSSDVWRFDNSCRRGAPGHWWSIVWLCRPRSNTDHHGKNLTKPPG